MMRVLILMAGAALSLAACSGNNQSSDANALAANDMTSDANLTMDSNMTSDPNMMGADGSMNAGGMDANMATNSTTENAMMQKDLNTNDRDTNLANGM
jgi:hypothetical protein